MHAGHETGWKAAVDRHLAADLDRHIPQTVDPALGPKERQRLKAASCSQLAAGEPPFGHPLWEALRYLGKGCALAVVPVSALLLREAATDDTLPRDHHSLAWQLQAWIEDMFALGLLAICSVTLLLAWNAAARAHAENAGARAIHALRTRRVCPCQLTKQDAQLLQRAQAAVETINDSDVHHADLIDRTGNDVQLPGVLWNIAERLRGLSDAVAPPDSTSQGAAAERAVSPRKPILGRVRGDIERKIKALERYAALVGEADERLEELEAHRSLDATAGQLLDALAATERPELTPAEMRHLDGSDTRGAEQALRDAVQAAEKAAAEAFASR